MKAFPVFQDISTVLLDTLNTMVVIVDENGIISFINKRTLAVLVKQYSHTVEANWFELCALERVTQELKSMCVNVLNEQ